MVRAPCCEKVGLKKGRWTREEDDILTKYIQENGEGCWRSVPKNAGLQRCGKSCRLRWINYLRPDLKRGNFSDEEKDMIIRLHATMGNRWSLIARQLNGRTDNEIKNYWNSHLSRKNLCDFKILSCKAEVIAEWKQKRGRSRQRVSSKKASVSALKHMNQEVGSIVAEKDMHANVNVKSFQIAEYLKDEDRDNALSMDAEESIIFNENQSDFLFSIDDALSIKIKELDISTRNSNISSANHKTGMKPCDQEVDNVTVSDEAWADWDWKSVANGQKLIEDDEMLSMLLDDSSDFQLSNHYIGRNC